MTSKRVKAAYTHLRMHLSDEIILWLQAFSSTATLSCNRSLLRVMLVSARGYGENLNSKNAIKIQEFLEAYCKVACHKYSLSNARSSISALKKFIYFMISSEAFSGQPLQKLKLALASSVTSDVYYFQSQRVSADNVEKFNFQIQIQKKKQSPTPGLLRKLEILKDQLNNDVYHLIASYIHSCQKIKQMKLSVSLVRYIKSLQQGLNEKDTYALVEIFPYIISHTASLMTSLVIFNDYITAYHDLIKHLVDNKYFEAELLTSLIPILKRKNKIEYEVCKARSIPSSFLNNLPKELSADEEFDEILYSTCTPEIALRLKEHVQSFKIVKHHREPIVAFLKYISSINSEWYKYPRIIQGELINFRGDLLNRCQRNTAYMKFQHLKNSFAVLISHGLLPNSIDLPNNLRRDTNTQKVRCNNPIITDVDIYEEQSLKLFSDSKSFLLHIERDIEENLRLLVSYARTIVHEAYEKYCNSYTLITQSEHDTRCGDYTLSELINSNTFSTYNPLLLENTVSYFTKNYDKLSNRAGLDSNCRIPLNDESLPYLGLTSTTASAMQIIITEELGINPHSLYSAKVFSTGFGLEFIQVDDEGGVRLKTVKPRAKYARTRNAPGNLTPLHKVLIQDIDASVCLKMALAMTAKAREVEKNNSLWLCMTFRGLIKSSPDDFRNAFKGIRHNLAIESNKDIFNQVTLKKIRSSKGILIYLKSNGDSLQTATYFGNAVKTTLHRYIPHYLTELIYRLKIRSFQRILLFMAIANDEHSFESAKLSEAQFKAQLEYAFSLPDMGGNLFDKLTSTFNNTEMEQSIYFCVSEKNLRLAITYAKEGKDDHLKELCKDVLAIMSTSNTPLKIMLRNAHKTIS